MSGPDAEPRPVAPKRPRSMEFRKRNKGLIPTPDQARRQSDVVQSAWRHFGAPGPAIAFLNTPHSGLQAQPPLHLAIESDEGLTRVEGLLAELTLRA